MREMWYGFPMERLEFEGREAIIVSPEKGSANGRLVIKTEYWDAFQEAAEVPLVKEGFHLCYIQNDNRWGGDDDLDRKARFVRHVAQTYGLCERAVPVGMSCGGLFAIKFAAKYPELVSCLYLDAPVVNYLSCPCGLGSGQPLDGGASLRRLLNVCGLTDMSQLLGYRQMPLDLIPKLLANRIPVVMVAGDSDTVTPYQENGLYIQQAYEGTGIDCEVYIKPGCGHHPHGLENPEPVVQFILHH